MVASARKTHHPKRHGKHQKQTKGFLQVYLPYVPLLLIVLTGLVFTTFTHPPSRRGVLAYATSVSIGDLLASTNQERATNGQSALGNNASLNQAAQAKANDMAARNYWSHNTPEGNPPWVFIDDAGYAYKKAGENLAYGFLTSGDTVNGWMNSPSHRENMLDGGYTEVGFGFANSGDYQSTGPETIVVAMYGTPLTVVAAAPTAPAPAPTATPTPQTKAVQQSAPAESPAPTPSEPVAPVASEAPAQTATKPVTTDAPISAEPPALAISRLAALTGEAAPWLTSFAVMTALVGGAALVLRHTIALRKFFVRGERYVLHHMVFDVTIVSLMGLCYIVSQTAGVIR